MSWNGRGRKYSKKTSDFASSGESPRRNPKAFRGIIAAAIVVVGAIVAFVLLMPTAEHPQTPEVKPTVKKEIPKVEYRPSKPKVEEPVVETPKKLPPQKVGETRDGYIKLPSGRMHRVKGVITNSVSATQFKGKYEIFDHHCENEIACLLTINPGEGLVGTPRYNGKFKAQFLESLKTPIIIYDDDSEEDKALKRDVMQAKQNLKEALDRGEDIEQIMLNTRKEYQDLARYKQELKGLIYEFKKREGVTDQDVEDYVQAANQMLETKGIAPMNIGPITRQKIRMMKLQEMNRQ